jgi:hypothetical protein
MFTPVGVRVEDFRTCAWVQENRVGYLPHRP